MKNLKKLWLGAAAAAPLLIPHAAHAATGDFAEEQTHYGFSGLAGQGDPLAVVGAKVANLSQLESDVQGITGFECSRSNGCLVVKDRDGLENNLPSTDDADERHKVALAIAGILLAAPDSQILFMDGLQKDSNNLSPSITNLHSFGVKGFVPTYTIAAGSQGTITTYLSNHTDIIGVAPTGYLTSSLVIQVGGTTYTTGNADTVWAGSPGNGDVMSRMDDIPVPWGTTMDSPEWGAAVVLGRVENQSGGPATRQTVLNASSARFNFPTGGSKVFKDGQQL